MNINMNWKTVKVIGSFVLILGVIFLVISSTSPQSYTGTDLKVEVGSGPVIVTNPSEENIAIQFASAGTRSFRVISDISDVTGNSVREGVGNSATQIFAVGIPPGTSEFLVTRGTNVAFSAMAPGELQLTVNPLPVDLARTSMMIAFVVILGLLYYASNVVEHSWIGVLRGKNAMTEITKPTPVVTSSDQGQALKAYGDNRARNKD